MSVMKNTNKFCLENNRLNNDSLEQNSSLTVTRNKLTVEISHHDNEETIVNYLRQGIHNFGLDLFFGSVAQNLEVIEKLKGIHKKESDQFDFSTPLSIYLKLSPRLHYIGKFKRNKPHLTLKLNKIVNLTANRDYASKSCHTFIYVNAKILMGNIKECDIICVGEHVQLQVVELNCATDLIICKVIVSGIVTPRMQVRFPKAVEKAHSKISPEELEDISLASRLNLNVIILDAPGNIDYYRTLRETLEELNINNLYLFARVTLSNIDSLVDCEWICNAYDGFLFDCSNNVKEDQIVKLPLGARELMEKPYQERKPILLQGCWSKLVDPTDYKYAFLLPDKFILPYCQPSHFRLFEAIFYKLSRLYKEKRTQETPLSYSHTFSIAAASFDFQVDAIIVCSDGAFDQAMQISHYRPRATIIVVVTNLNMAVNYLSMHHNIYILELKNSKETVLSEEEEIQQKLFNGVHYALSRKIIDEYSKVILVYRKIMATGSTDRFSVINVDGEYAETIRNVILQ